MAEAPEPSLEELIERSHRLRKDAERLNQESQELDALIQGRANVNPPPAEPALEKAMPPTETRPR